MQDKKTIIYIGGFELPDKNAAALRVISNSKIFQNFNYKVILIGVDRNLKKEDGLTKNNIVTEGIESYAIAYPKNIKEWLGYLLGNSEIKNFLSSVKDKVESIILYNYPFPASLIFSLILKKYGVKCIFDITEWPCSKGRGKLNSLIKWLDTILRIKISPYFASAIMTTSSYMSERYEKRGLAVLDLPTLYDTKLFQEPSYTVNKIVKFIYIGNPFNSVIAGNDRNTVKERLDKVILSLLDFNDNYQYELNIFGVTQSEYVSVYPEHECILNHNNDTIIFHGKKENRYIKEQLMTADFSIFFRDDTRVNKAGFPSKFSESVSSGIPIICSNIASLKKHENIKGVFLASNGNEIKMIQSCIDISKDDLNELKKTLYHSKYFDYRQYEKQVECFFIKLGVL